MQDPNGHLPCVTADANGNNLSQGVSPVEALLLSYSDPEGVKFDLEEHAPALLAQTARACFQREFPEGKIDPSEESELVCIRQTGPGYVCRWIMPRGGW